MISGTVPETLPEGCAGKAGWARGSVCRPGKSTEQCKPWLRAGSRRNPYPAIRLLFVFAPAIAAACALVSWGMGGAAILPAAVDGASSFLHPDGAGWAKPIG